ncbi:MAG TPA: hypothetical protein VKA48_13155 [Gammaproteobacteria bacterium]|nr:hypothetical protein [Gammaproteobacteria bacterium]
MKQKTHLTRANVLMEAARHILWNSPEDAIPYGALADLYMRASADYYEAGHQEAGEDARKRMVGAQDRLKANPQPIR